MYVYKNLYKYIVSNILAAYDERNSCENNTRCLNSQICDKKKCVDPCPGPCGTNALCNVNNHNLNCSCARCYEGDPYKICTQFPGEK